MRKRPSASKNGAALEDAHRADVHRVLEPLHVQEAGVERSEAVVLASSAGAMRRAARSLRSTAWSLASPTAVWTISPELVLALDEHLGPPVDSYVNGSQTWLVGDEPTTDVTLEFRLHPVAGYRPPAGAARTTTSGRRSSTQLSQRRRPARAAPRRRGAPAHRPVGRARVLRRVRRRARTRSELATLGHRRARPRRPTASASSTTRRSATRGSAPNGKVSIVALLARPAHELSATRGSVLAAPGRACAARRTRSASSSPSIARNARSSQRCAPASGCGSASRAKKPTALVSSGWPCELAADHPAVEHDRVHRDAREAEAQAVEHRDQRDRLALDARLLEHFLHRDLRRRVADVGPADRVQPPSGVGALREQDLALRRCRRRPRPRPSA